MKEDKSNKKKEEEKKEQDIPTSSKEKIEARPKLKAIRKKKKYPILLVAENYLVYKTENGNVWVAIIDAKNKYKISEEYEV